MSLLPRLMSLAALDLPLPLPLLLLLLLQAALGSAATTASQRLVLATEEEENGLHIAADQQWKIG